MYLMILVCYTYKIKLNLQETTQTDDLFEMERGVVDGGSVCSRKQQQKLFYEVKCENRRPILVCTSKTLYRLLYFNLN